MNQTVLSGNLTADIETRDIGEQHLSKFTLACNEGERVVFLPVEAWNMPHLADYLGKGSKAAVAGGLKLDQWETDAGEKRSRILLNAYKVEFLDPPEAADERPARKPAAAQSRGRNQRPQARRGRAKQAAG